MGTHPIFESDFDCLTETKKMTIEQVLKTVPLTENVVFSLINVHHAFALAMLGADQETAINLARLIGYDDEPQACLKLLRSKLDDFAKLDSINQSAAIFVNGKFKLKSDYVASAAKELDSIIDSINVTSPVAAAAKINKWVESQTNGKIDSLVKPDLINAQTLAILTSTTLFKGSWAAQFEKIEDQTFYASKGPVKTAFMRVKKKKHFSVYVSDDVTLIGIPYKDDMMMTIAMPPEGKLGEFEKNLKSPSLLLDQCRHQRGEVQVTMPMFSVKSELDMKEIFTQLGHGALFDQSVRHNYSRMTDQDVFISDAIHQATIDVDECGTVATAATAVVMMLRCMPALPQIITIDKPFLFFLHKNDNILFAVRVAQF